MRISLALIERQGFGPRGNLLCYDIGAMVAQKHVPHFTASLPDDCPISGGADVNCGLICAGHIPSSTPPWCRILRARETAHFSLALLLAALGLQVALFPISQTLSIELLLQFFELVHLARAGARHLRRADLTLLHAPEPRRAPGNHRLVSALRGCCELPFPLRSVMVRQLCSHPHSDSLSSPDDQTRYPPHRLILASHCMVPSFTPAGLARSSCGMVIDCWLNTGHTSVLRRRGPFTSCAARVPWWALNFMRLGKGADLTLASSFMKPLLSVLSVPYSYVLSRSPSPPLVVSVPAHGPTTRFMLVLISSPPSQLWPKSYRVAAHTYIYVLSPSPSLVAPPLGVSAAVYSMREGVRSRDAFSSTGGPCAEESSWLHAYFGYPRRCFAGVGRCSIALELLGTMVHDPFGTCKEKKNEKNQKRNRKRN
ncbi:hypothetical protein K438DRAFT_420392 [Mycena galopus ATCC 62051]|nr:hypothetical protein K438DRAFT_420392 [Mycena galopus ATCC 62051]